LDGFLAGRKIHEVVRVAQGCLHSIKVRNQRSMMMKVDMYKDRDRASWLYIRLIIIHLVFFHNFVVWIMSCISSIYFDVFNFVVWIMSCISLLNGVVTPLFRLGRGLKQGCPLYPLLFVLIYEGLSRILKEEEGNGSIKWVPIGVSCNITHLLFVDDILNFCEGTRRVIKKFKGIMDLFCKATGMVINMEKSMMILWGMFGSWIKQYSMFTRRTKGK
jgi:hypothetical protein